MSPPESILFVDDEPNVLDGIRRQLRKSFTVHTANSGSEGLAMVQEQGPFAVVVSDMKMPGMNGAEFLTQVRSLDPESVRMILSGQSELDAAIAAINDGNVFRFLTKPCEREELIQGLEAALDQHRLMKAEKEILEKTLFGAVEVLTQILSMINPDAFSRSSRIRQYAECIAAKVERGENWQIRLAAMLSQIGSIGLPADLLSRAYSGETMSAEESEMFASHPQLAAKLLSTIPRLETVSKIIEHELEPVDRSEIGEDPNQWDIAVLGAEILRAAIEFDRMIGLKASRPDAVRSLKEDHGLPALLADPLLEAERGAGLTVSREIAITELTPKMVFETDVKTLKGALLVRSGEEVSYPLLVRLRNFAKGQGVTEPLRVKIPL